MPVFGVKSLKTPDRKMVIS
ncbi:hypothetical protein CRE_02437 [Caenorhabditis remanei]|uniref:Uncharacterized protein n=1 Tax=Caenorhabditis remanei TaxID=31234 RepID=E3MIR7_CAERE|nr:hypothetical protein CRE_02437 [Caenorhabditis remanei]